MPRKTDTGTDIKDSTGNSAGGNGGGGSVKDALSIDDHNLPKSIVTRLAKGVLPQNTNVQRDAILALSKGGTVFINYLCATANEQAKLHGRKTINPKDILEAMHIMEFNDFLPRLKAELDKFNELASEKRAAIKKPFKPKTDEADQASSPTQNLPSDALNKANDAPPAAKKVRVGDAAADPGAKQAKGSSVIATPVLVRGWGDEDEEEDDEMGEDDELDGVVETESEGFDEESDRDLDEGEIGHYEEVDEALDNGVDSD